MIQSDVYEAHERTPILVTDCWHSVMVLNFVLLRLFPLPGYPSYFDGSIFFPLLIVVRSSLWTLLVPCTALFLLGLSLYYTLLNDYARNDIKWLAGLVIVPGCLFIAFIGWYSLGANLRYTGSARVSPYLYQLVRGEDNDFDICTNAFWILYQCDSAGLVCRARFLSDQLCNEQLEADKVNAAIEYDAASDQISLRRGSEVIYTLNQASNPVDAPTQVPY